MLTPDELVNLAAKSLVQFCLIVLAVGIVGGVLIGLALKYIF